MSKISIPNLDDQLLYVSQDGMQVSLSNWGNFTGMCFNSNAEVQSWFPIIFTSYVHESTMKKIKHKIRNIYMRYRVLLFGNNRIKHYI